MWRRPRRSWGKTSSCEVRSQVALGLPVGHRRQAHRREEALEAGVHLLDAIADRGHVTAPRRQHGGPEGQMIRPRRADDLAFKIPDHARMHVWPVTGGERIPGRLGRLEDLGGDLPGEALPGPLRTSWGTLALTDGVGGTPTRARPARVRARLDDAPTRDRGTAVVGRVAVRSASSRRACTRSWISACRTASK